MSWSCVACGKAVYHAEKMETDGKVFHANCHAKWVAEQKATGKGAWGGKYEAAADTVQPAYYRTADSSGVSRMESGGEYKNPGEN